MNQLKMIWNKYIAIFYFLYSIIIHTILVFVAAVSIFLAFVFVQENPDYEFTRSAMKEISGFCLLLVIPFLSFFFRFLFLSKISCFNKLLEKKNLLITGILDIIVSFALLLLFIVVDGYPFTKKGVDNFISYILSFLFFLFFSNFVTVLIFSLIQKFRNWKKTEIIKIIFFIISLILNQFVGYLFLVAIVLLYAYLCWDNLYSSIIFLYSFVFVYSILFQIFDSKLYYYLDLISDNTIVVKTFLLLKSLFFIVIFLSPLAIFEEIGKYVR